MRYNLSMARTTWLYTASSCVRANKESCVGSRYAISPSSHNLQCQYRRFGKRQKMIGTSKRSPMHWHFANEWQSFLDQEFKSMIKLLSRSKCLESLEADGVTICNCNVCTSYR
jgi:hypothetical protein